MNAIKNLLLKLRLALGPVGAKALELLLPVLKPALKLAAIMVVKQEGDYVLAKLKAAISGDGLSGVDRIIDGAQKALKARLLNLSLLPQSLRDKLDKIIDEQGDALQTSIRQAASTQGEAALDIAVQIAEDALIAKIQAL